MKINLFILIFTVIFVLLFNNLQLFGENSSSSTLDLKKNEAVKDYNKGIESYNKSLYKEASEYFKNATDIDYEYVEAYYFLASSYYKLKEFKEAKKICESVLRDLKPNDEFKIKFNNLLLQVSSEIEGSPTEKKSQSGIILKKSCCLGLFSSYYCDNNKISQSFIWGFPDIEPIIKDCPEALRVYKQKNIWQGLGCGFSIFPALFTFGAVILAPNSLPLYQQDILIIGTATIFLIPYFIAKSRVQEAIEIYNISCAQKESFFPLEKTDNICLHEKSIGFQLDLAQFSF